MFSNCKYDLTKVLGNYVIPNGSIVAFNCYTGDWVTVTNYDALPSWTTHTCEVYNNVIQEITIW